MYPKHVGHENGGCGHLGRAPLSPPTFGGHSCKKDCMVAPHESRLVYTFAAFAIRSLWAKPGASGGGTTPDGAICMTIMALTIPLAHPSMCNSFMPSEDPCFWRDQRGYFARGDTLKHPGRLLALAPHFLSRRTVRILVGRHRLLGFTYLNVHDQRELAARRR
jgi:hypothetical protein